MVSPYKNQQCQDYLFCILHKYIQHSIIKQGKSWEIKNKLEQVATSFETILVFLERIKTKCGYILATRSKAGVKPSSRSLDKKSAAHYVIGFVNRKLKVEFHVDSN